jgi:hypothetical protein
MVSRDGTREAIHRNSKKMIGLGMRPEIGLIRLLEHGNDEGEAAIHEGIRSILRLRFGCGAGC